MPELRPLDTSRCPLCGMGNACAMASSIESAPPPADCWCMATKIDAQVLQALPAQARGLACICPRCARSAQPVL